MSEANEPQPKIIVDEDWKTRVEAEREAAKTGPSETKSTPRAAPAREDRPRDYPPANFTMHLTTIAAQAMMALGQAPNPITGKAELDLPQAKHFIDTLAMLEEKTAGGRTPEESNLLDNLLHELRMAFVAIQQHAASAAEKKS